MTQASKEPGDLGVLGLYRGTPISYEFPLTRRGEREVIKWIGQGIPQLAALEAHDLVPAFPGVLKKAYGTKPFSGSTDLSTVEMRPY